MFVSSVSRKLSICLMLGVAVLTGLPNQSHAVGNLDAALLKEGATIVKKLRKAGVKTVGVLQFGAKVDGAKSTKGKKNQVRTRMGPINKYMAEYVENALVQSNDLLRPLTILEDPAELAKKRIKKPNLATEAARKQFFRLKYPVYGARNKVVAPQAFIIGQVTLSKSYDKTAVMLALLRPSGKLSLLHKFTVPTDQFVLGEFGIGFSYSRKYPKMRKFGSRSIYRRSPLAARNAAFPELDDLGGTEPGGIDPGGNPGTDPGGTNPGGTEDPFLTDNGIEGSDNTIPAAGPVDVKVLYDGTAQELLADDAFATADTNSPADQATRNNFRITEPAENTSVEIHVTNNTPDVIGIVVMVAGKSTLHAEQRWEDAKRWILDPQETIKLKGFYDVAGEQNKVRPFKVADAIETDTLFAAADEEEAKRLTQIEVHVFRPGTDTAAIRYDGQRSLRRPASLRGKRGISQTAFVKALNRRQPLTKRGVIIQGDISKDANLKNATLGNVVRTDLMVITYMDRPGGGGTGTGEIDPLNPDPLNPSP